ncbi:MAG: radical SAM protein [Candidatus Pacebacteria bacterium]|nr:radical SAM protein [Candidatus Paceibacterota bacterium]
MKAWDEVKKKLAAESLDKLMGIGSNLSDSHLIGLLNFGEKISRDEDMKQVIINARKEVEKGHPWVGLAKKLYKSLNPNYRKLIINFFVNSVIWGVSKRKEIEEEKGFFPPFTIVISPTMRCNLQCIGCYAGAYQQGKGLSGELVDRIITEGKEMGILFYTISGGEPFARRDLLGVYEKHNDCVFHIYTNGTLLDKIYIQKLVFLGNVIPLISIEGTEKTTDDRRGKGTYEKIMKTMDNLREAGIPFGFSATHTSLNTEEILTDEFIELMIEKGAFLGWFFQYIPIGREPDLNLMPTPEARNLRRQTVLRWRNEKPIVVYDFWNDGNLVNGCIAGGRYCHIISNGDVEPCVFAHFAVDNIKDKSLEEILTSPFFKAIQKRRPYIDDDENTPNHLRPCMIIDHPEVLREVVREAGAQPTCPEAEKILEGPLADGLDKVAFDWKKIATPIWEKEYKKQNEQKAVLK